jgi:hypothetical protein
MASQTHLITLDETPTIHVDYQTPPLPVLMRTPQQVESADPLAETLDNVPRPALLVIRELSDESRFFTVCIAAD